MPETAPRTAELLGRGDLDIQAALKAWKDTGEAPTIRNEEFIQYPYGLIEAVVTCQPLRVCDIELEAGGRSPPCPSGIAPGGSPARRPGEGDTMTPHVLVKPTEFGIATNAVITTTRRTYTTWPSSRQPSLGCTRGGSSSTTGRTSSSTQIASSARRPPSGTATRRRPGRGSRASPFVDALFETAVLVVGVGTHQERVTIRRGGAAR